MLSDISQDTYHCYDDGHINFEEIVHNQAGGHLIIDHLDVPLSHSYPTSISGLNNIPFTIGKSKDGEVALSYEVESIGSKWSTGSSVKDEIIPLYSSRLINFIHYYVFSCLVPDTDVKISSKIKGVQSDINSRLTPDFITSAPGGFVVVEFTTTRGNASSAYDEKIGKYSHALRSIINTYNKDKVNPNLKIGIKYYVISVSQNMIVTNLELSDLIVNELAYRFQMAISIHSRLVSLNIISSSISENDELNVKRIKQFFLAFNNDERFKNLRTDEWSEDNYNKIMANHDDQELMHLEKQLFSKSFNQVVEGLGVSFKAKKEDKLEENEELQKNCRVSHEVFEKEYAESNKDNLRADLKAMVQFPLIVPKIKNGNRSISINLLTRTNELSSSGCVEGRIWSECILESSCNQSKFQTDPSSDTITEGIDEEMFTFPESSLEVESLCKEVFKKTLDSKKQNSLRNTYQRVQIEVSKSDELELAKVGIWGKKNKHDFDVIRYRDDSKRAFCLKESSTDDLDDLLGNKSFLLDFFYPRLGSNDTIRGIRDLLEIGWSVHTKSKIVGDMIRSIDKICQTPFFHYCKLVSDVAVEISISLKQNCRAKQFIFKKLKDWDVWLLIKPTKSSSHIFYSILGFNSEIQFELPESSSVFKKVFKTSKYWFTPFLSANISKLTNLCLCESRAFGLLTFWSHSFKVLPFKVTSSEIHSRIEKFSDIKTLLDDNKILSDLIPPYFNSYYMTVINLIISMIDKSEVEEEITKTRYIVMESLVDWPLKPNLSKMLKKTSTHMRNRMSVWLYRKHKNYSIYLAGRPIVVKSETVREELTLTGSHLVWEGFKNPYLDIPISDIQQVINLFYLGYIRNKDQYPENNTLSKLYKKILDIEGQFTEEIESRIGREDKQISSGTKHEYNITLLKAATDYCIRTRMSNNSNYLKEIEITIANFLCNSNIEDSMTTLKASSPFGPEFYQRESVNSRYKRLKVIEAIQPYVKGDKTHLIDILPEIYPSVFLSDCLHIDIFQKNQHGGLREIFVLNITNRVLQFVVETISRKICSTFEGETMTHPLNKKIIPENHHKRASQTFRDGYITLCTSADAAKWSQNQYSHKFAIILLRFLPAYMHSFMSRILRLWKCKKILINPKLLEIFDNNQNCLFYDPIIQDMYDGYHGSKKINWITHRSPYITVKTGMMQGILHYTSSLFHSVLNEFTKSIMIKRHSMMIKKLSTKIPSLKGTQPIISIMQSSDDSCLIYSISVKEVIDVQVQQFLACVMQMMKVNFGEEVGIINSDKSSINTKFIYEFNSDFEFGNSHYKPDIKHVFSANLISEEELLAARQEELSTLLTIYLESGGYSYTANFLQVGQAFLNYRLLGSSTTDFFSAYVLLVQFIPDPASGFFLMDNPLCPGICGFKFNLWTMCRTKQLGSLYKHYLNEIERKFVKGERKKPLETTQSGAFMQTTKLSYGNRERWLSMVRKMSLPIGWREYFDCHPNVLYRRGETTDEFINRVAMKMHSPGVASSLSKGNCISRTISASSYILKVRSLSNETSWLREDSNFEDRLTLIESILEALKTRVGCLSEDDLIRLFPFHANYKETTSLLSSLKLADHYHSHAINYKRNITSVSMFESSNFAFESPSIIIPFVWFGHEDDKILKPKYSKDMVDSLFEGLKVLVPWLDEDANVSLEQSPFSSHLELKTWLEKFGSSSRTVRLLGAPISTRAGLSTLASVIFQNFSSNYKLLSKADFTNEVHYKTSSGSLRHHLLLASTIPYLDSRSTCSIMKYLIKEFSCDLVEDSRGQRKRTNALFIMSRVLLGESPLDVMMRIKNLKSGVLGGFSIRQKSIRKPDGTIEYIGSGEWTGLIDGTQVRFTIDSDYGVSYASKIFLRNPDDLSLIYYPLLNLFRELNVSINKKLFKKTARDALIFLDDSGPSSYQGVPVSKSTDEQINFEYCKNSRLILEWSGYNLRLVLSIPGSSGSPPGSRYIAPALRHLKPPFTEIREEVRITVLTYLPNDGDFIHGNLMKSSSLVFDGSVEGMGQLTDLEKIWMRSDSMRPDNALDYIKHTVNRYYKSQDNAHKEVFNQCSENIRSHLSYRGIHRRTAQSVISVKQSVHKVEENLGCVMDIMDFEMDDDFIDDFLALTESKDQDILEMSEGLDSDDRMLEAEQFFDLIQKPSDIIRVRNSRVFTQHPLLKDYVTSLHENYSIGKIRRMFCNMEVDCDDRHHIPAICLFNQVSEEEVKIVNASAPKTRIQFWSGDIPRGGRKE